MYLRTICPQENEELMSELILQIDKSKETRLQHAYHNNYLEYVCFKIAKRILYGNIKNTGIFHKRNRLVFDDKIEVVADETQEIDTVDIWERVAKLHWYEKTLFNEYYKAGLTLKQIEEKFGINQKSVHYSIRKTIKLLKNEQNQKDN